MPIDEVGTLVPMMPHQVNVPIVTGTGYLVTILIQSDNDPEVQGREQAMDDALQSLVDYLQVWPGRDPQSDVTGQKTQFMVYGARPTDPPQEPEQ